MDVAQRSVDFTSFHAAGAWEHRWRLTQLPRPCPAEWRQNSIGFWREDSMVFFEWILINPPFFPTCQVRVVRFYHSCSAPPPPPRLAILFLFFLLLVLLLLLLLRLFLLDHVCINFHLNFRLANSSPSYFWPEIRSKLFVATVFGETCETASAMCRWQFPTQSLISSHLKPI